jgi:tripartite-type tricarboxylate transporter receptor subunit TctC
MTISRRAAFGLSAGLAAGTGHAAQAVTLLVGAPAGSAPDLWARGVSPFLERHWARSTITVVNRPGMGGIAAARALAGATPDGLTLAAVGTPTLLARAVEQGQLAMVERLQFVASVAEETLLLVTAANGPIQTMDALRGLPPTALLGTPPPGNAAQLAGSALAARLGLSSFPFANAPAVRQAVQAGHVPVAVLAAPDAMGLLREGRLVAIAVAAEARSSQWPEVPTLREQGIAFSAQACRGFALPGGTPEPVVRALAAALSTIVADPEFIAQANAFGYLPHFQGTLAWMARLQLTAQELAGRWQTDPWVQRPG